MAPRSAWKSRWWARLRWFVLIWAASVGALGIAAYCMRLLMRIAGLSA
jgi:hypothetical protein